METPKDSYLSSYWQSAIEKPISISGGISLLLSILATFNYFFKWIEEGTMNTILLIIPVVTFFIILLIYTPYAVYKKERKKIKALQEIVEHGSQESLCDLRRQLREPKVMDIANTLQKLNERLQKLVGMAIRNGIDEIKMREAAGEFIESLKIGKNKYTDNQLTKEKMESVGRMMRKKLNIKSFGDRNFTAFLFKIIGVLENNEIGISKITSKDKEYESLSGQLEKQRRNIASLKLAAAIDSYIWYSRGFASLMLFYSYGKPIMKEMPAETAAMTSIMPDAFNSAMQLLLADVNKCIEDYLLGETVTKPPPI
jgi:hypothetical protein